MQWNKISWNQESLMFEGLENGEWMYFVHSYVAPITNATVATCHYGERLCAAQINGNLWATQFHPEKSGQGGLRILKNFVDSVGGV